MSNPNQLHLLADHIKLSLLEQQRARLLHINDQDENDVQAGHISRSLDQFRDGLEALNAEKGRLEQDNDEAALATLNDSLPSLQKQYRDLLLQFQGHTTPSTLETLNSPNDSSLAADFAHANSNAASRKTVKPKAVRFTDSPTPTSTGAADKSSHQGNADADADASRELFGSYRDDPSPGYREYEDGLTNQQIHQHHSQILDEQDEHLDRLGESISRQRELSMLIGDELDDHVAILDDMEAVTDRHQSRLDRASRTLGKVARGAKENKQMTAIVILIIILILLLAILK